MHMTLSLDKQHFKVVYMSHGAKSAKLTVYFSERIFSRNVCVCVSSNNKIMQLYLLHVKHFSILTEFWNLNLAE